VTAAPLPPLGALQPRSAQPRPRSTAAVRSRRCRDRRKSGITIVQIEIAEFEVLGALIDRHRLTEGGSRQREVVGAALARIIQEWTMRNKL
jgi:hypothetical protein